MRNDKILPFMFQVDPSRNSEIALGYVRASGHKKAQEGWPFYHQIPKCSEARRWWKIDLQKVYDLAILSLSGSSGVVISPLLCVA